MAFSLERLDDAPDAVLVVVEGEPKPDILNDGDVGDTYRATQIAANDHSPTDTTITSLVIEPIDAPQRDGDGAAARQSRNRSSRVQSEAELSFSMALKEGSVVVSGVGPIPDGTRCVREEMWRNYFIQISVSEHGDAQRKAWQRAKQVMRDSGKVNFDYPYFWTQ